MEQSKKPGPTPMRRFRADDELWRQFTGAVARSPDPEADLSTVLRQLVRWYAGVPGAELPKRPGVETRRP